MHVLLIVAVRCHAAAAAGARALDTGGADDPAVRNCQGDVVDAEIREELGPGMKLVTIPALVLKHAELREPLRDEEEVADGAGARADP